MGLRTYLLLVCLLTNKDTVTSLSLSCIAGVIEVVEGRQKTVTCNGLRAEDTVKWILQTSSDVLNLGSCSPTSAAGVFTCIPSQLSQMTSSRTLGTESVLTIDFTTMNDDSIRLTLGTLKCQTQENGPFDACQMDFVYPPEVICAVQILKDVLPWRVHGYCNVTKALSMLGRYSCQWYVERESSEGKLGSSIIITMTTQPGGRYVSGSCEMPTNVQFPTTAGSLKYKVAFTPEKNVTTTADGISEVQRPSQPTVNCDPKLYVPENTSVICTCHTQSVGTPGGYLKWSKGSNNIFNRVINSGIFDFTSLPMVPYILQKTDHNNTQFRCDVVWAENITGSVYTASVGYVDQSVIQINNLLNLSVAENQTVTFNCSANGRPTPSMSLINKGNGTLIRNATSPLTHTLIAAQCEDTSTYSCLASNGMGKDTISDAKLYVNCKPRLHSDTALPDTLHPMKYNGQAVAQTFTIIAYPTPSNFSFLYWGSGTGNCACKSAVINIVLNMTCTNLPTLFMSMCTLSVDNMTNSDSAGVYSVSLTNAHGSVDLKFQVDVDGTSESETTSAGFVQGVGVGVGVIVAAIAVLALFTAFCLWRKKQKLTCIDKTVESHESPLTPLTSLNKDVSEIPMDTALAKPPGLYDPLRQSEIGQVSQYSELSQYESISESSKPKESEGKSKGTPVAHVYQNTTVI